VIALLVLQAVMAPLVGVGQSWLTTLEIEVENAVPVSAPTAILTEGPGGGVVAECRMADELAHWVRGIESKTPISTMVDVAWIRTSSLTNVAVNRNSTCVGLGVRMGVGNDVYGHGS
jgi:hypothetical protein